jgi:putative transposase
MCTKPRIVVQGLIYEITSKGARGIDVLSSMELKSFFQKELALTLKMFSYQCYAWSIMDDHYHLVIKSSEIPISLFMQRLNSVYAKHFNKVRNESGVVFYKRFASIIVEETRLRELVRYVHLNPVRAGDCTLEQLDTYEWCGHYVLLQNDLDHFQNTKGVLTLFHGPEPSKMYRAYVYSKQPDHENDKAVKTIRDANRGVESFSKSQAWVLGSPLFVNDTLEKDRCRRARIARHLRENITFEIIHTNIESTMNLSKNDLYHQGRLNERDTARLMFAFIGKFRFDFSGTGLARYLGVSCSAVTKMISRCSTVLNKNFLIDIILNEMRISV